MTTDTGRLMNGFTNRDWPRPQDVSREEQLAAASEAAQFLYGRGARSVWLFGSIAKGRRLGVGVKEALRRFAEELPVPVA